MPTRLPTSSRMDPEFRPTRAALRKRPSGRSRLQQDDPSTISSPAQAAADPDKAGRPRSDRNPHNHSPPTLTSTRIHIMDPTEPAQRGALPKPRNSRASVSRAGRPAETVAQPRDERAEDEVLGVFDQVAHELVGKAAVQGERVPVALIELIAGPDRRVACAQLQREVGVALDADFERRALQRAKRQDLAGELEHRMFGL